MFMRFIKNKCSVVFIFIVVVGVLFFLHEDDYVADLGLGMTVSGDKYVDSGDWVFNCHNGDLIKKDGIPFPDFDGNDLMNYFDMVLYNDFKLCRQGD